jgi:hypothetical protein
VSIFVSKSEDVLEARKSRIRARQQEKTLAASIETRKIPRAIK